MGTRAIREEPNRELGQDQKRGRRKEKTKQKVGGALDPIEVQTVQTTTNTKNRLTPTEMTVAIRGVSEEDSADTMLHLARSTNVAEIDEMNTNN